MGYEIYRNEFYSTEGTLWKIDILDATVDPEVQGDPTTFTTSPPFFNLQYSAPQNRFDPFLPSELKLSVIVEDATFEIFLNTVIAAGEDRYFVKLYKDSTLYWAGALIADNIKISDASYPYDFELSFTDGLGTLKDKPYATYNQWREILYTGKETLIKIIYNCLIKAGPGIHHYDTVYSNSDYFISTNIHWYETHHDFSWNEDPLLYTKLKQEVFQKVDNNIVKAISCYDVLYNVLSLFGARIMMCGGHYKIIQINEHICPIQVFRHYRLSDGAYVTYSYQSPHITDYDVLTGRTYTYSPGLSQVIRKYKYTSGPGGANLIPNKTSYSTWTDFYNYVSGGNGETLKFSGTLTSVITSTNTDPLDYAVRLRWTMTLRITGDSGIKYLKKENDLWEWSTSTSTVYIYSNYFTKLGNRTEVFYTCITSPEVPETASGEFMLVFDGFESEEDGQIVSLDATVDNVCSNFAIINVFPPNKLTSGLLTLGVKYRINNYEENDDFSNVFDDPNTQTNADGTEFTATGTTPTHWAHGSELLDLSVLTPAGEIEYKTKNHNFSSLSNTYSPTKVIVGDGIHATSIGAIETSDGDGTWYVADTWQVKNRATTKTIHQLYASEVICGQLTPVCVMTLNCISSSLASDKTLVHSDGSKYLFLSGNLQGREELWSADWAKIENVTVSTISAGEHNWSLQSWVSENYYEQIINTPEDNSIANNNNSSDPNNAYAAKNAVNGTLTITSDTAVTVRAGYMIVYMILYIETLTDHNCDIKIGTTAGGAEIFHDTLVLSEKRSLPVHLLLSMDADSNIYVSSPSWTDLTVKLYTKQEQIV